MKRLLLTLLHLAAFAFLFLPTYSFSSTPGPFLYTQNSGQILQSDGRSGSDILFTAESNGVTAYIKANSISYVFQRVDVPVLPDQGHEAHPEGWHSTAEMNATTVSGYRMDLELVGANEQPVVRTGLPHFYRQHFYRGRGLEPLRDVASFETVTFESVYPNIDLVLHSQAGQMKYDFIVHPGGNPAEIAMKLVGGNGAKLDEEGKLHFECALGEIVEEAPYCFQGNQVVEGSFVLEGDLIRFNLSSYDQETDLTIDPVRIWSTYFGGNSNDGTEGGVAMNDQGEVYFYGSTASLNYPVDTGAFQSAHGGSTWDCFVAKLDSNGNRVWATYLGGGASDYGRGGVDLDVSGNVYVHGYTGSADFPVTTGAFQDSLQGGEDSFVAKFSPNGTLLWATYLGGGGNEEARGSLSIDNFGNVLVLGSTQSTDFPATSGVVQDSLSGNWDIYVANLNSSGSLVWATYFGGTGFDQGIGGITTDPWGNIYFSGETASTDFPVTTNAHQNTFGGFRDAFLVKLSPTGALNWATFYGGFSWDYAEGKISSDPFGNIYVCGNTISPNFPTSSGAFQASIGGGFDAFLLKFDTAGVRDWATFIGGSSSDFGTGGVIAVAADDIVLHGYTGSLNFPVSSDAFQDTYAGSSDIFLMRFDGSGNRIWGTFYGGTASETGGGDISYNEDGRIVFSGYTQSSNFPTTPGAYQSSFGGGPFDSYIVTFSLCRLFSIFSGSESVCRGDSNGVIHLDILGAALPLQYNWSTGDTLDGLSNLPAGTYSVQAIDRFGCQISDSTILDTLELPDVIIGNDTVLCSGQTLFLDAGSGYINYQWNDSVSTQTRIIATPGTYSVSVEDMNGCWGADTVSLALQAAPNVDLGNDTIICAQDSLPLDAGNGFEQYVWSTGATTQSIFAPAGGAVAVQVTDSFGCSASDTLLINFHAPASNFARSVGPATLCQNDTLELVGDHGFQAYLWSTGDASQTTSVSAGGDYVLQVVDSLGCLGFDTISVDYLNFPDPNPQINPGPVVALCGGNPVTLDAGSGFTLYEWSNGATSQTVSVSQPTKLAVMVTNGFGCSELSDSVVIIPGTNPQPAITIVGNTLTSTPFSSYQWYLNGNLIPGATNQSYTALQNGQYTIEVIDANGCAGEADTLFIMTGLNPDVEEAAVEIFPNPSEGTVNVRSIQGLNGPVTIDFVTLQGKILSSFQFNSLQDTKTLDLTSFSAGVYLLKIQSDQAALIQKLILR